jgi:phage-related protein
MASKPTVTVTLAGDESKLTQAFDKVGQSSEQMADKVDKSAKSMDDTGSSLDGLGESTDAAEGKFQGFADTLTGTQDIMTGFREGDIVGMATGFADLAGGLTEFVVPALASFASFLGGPLRAAMTFISSHPLLIVLGLLVVAFVTLWTTSETFRNIVIGVFNAVAGFIKNVFGGAINWIKGAWDAVIGWFGALPGRIGGALGALGSIISGVFKGALNVVIDALNWGLDRINWLIDRINDVSGLVGIPEIPHIPHIKRLHTGGIVPGMPGQEVPIMAMAGERVTPASQAGGAVVVGFVGDTDSAFASAFQMLVNTGAITVQVT